MSSSGSPRSMALLRWRPAVASASSREAHRPRLPAQNTRAPSGSSSSSFRCSVCTTSAGKHVAKSSTRVAPETSASSASPKRSSTLAVGRSRGLSAAPARRRPRVRKALQPSRQRVEESSTPTPAEAPCSSTALSVGLPRPAPRSWTTAPIPPKPGWLRTSSTGSGTYVDGKQLDAFALARAGALICCASFNGRERNSVVKAKASLSRASTSSSVQLFGAVPGRRVKEQEVEVSS
mmetsp:Transcript_14881/g.42707  ORF Transcript_14881/g.42707 Transcript_14881/m.42707 type:complete len:235 (-) Transcript_14881:98-802(-)